MNRLYGMRTYLVGAIDRVPDGGVQWRDDITPFLNSLGVVVYDPCKKPLLPGEDAGLETPESRIARAKAKRAGDYNKVTEEGKVIRATDLRMVDTTDFLVVNIDIDVHACGTYEEVTTANRGRHPILVHVEQGKVNCPDWLLSMLGPKSHDTVFDTWDQMKEYLLRVNDATFDELKELNKAKRWVFFDLAKIYKQAEDGFQARQRGLVHAVHS